MLLWWLDVCQALTSVIRTAVCCVFKWPSTFSGERHFGLGKSIQNPVIKPLIVAFNPKFHPHHSSSRSFSGELTMVRGDRVLTMRFEFRAQPPHQTMQGQLSGLRMPTLGSCVVRSEYLAYIRSARLTREG